MKRIGLCFAAILAAVCLGPAVHAEGPVEKGMMELNLAGSLTSTNLDDVDSELDQRSLAFDFGYFVADNHQIGAELMYTGLGIEEADMDIYNLNAYYSFHIPAGSDKFVPYIGAKVGLGKMEMGAEGESEDLDVMSYGAFVGLKFLITPSAAFSIEPSYLIQTYEADAGDDLDASSFGVNVGISIFF